MLLSKVNMAKNTLVVLKQVRKNKKMFKMLMKLLDRQVLKEHQKVLNHI